MSEPLIMRDTVRTSERANSNSKTLFCKDCNVGGYAERERERERERGGGGRERERETRKLPH